jgi:hypothetical protein
MNGKRRSMNTATQEHMVYVDSQVVAIPQECDYEVRCEALVPTKSAWTEQGFVTHAETVYTHCHGRPSWVRAGCFVCYSHAHARLMYVEVGNRHLTLR